MQQAAFLIGHSGLCIWSVFGWLPVEAEVSIDKSADLFLLKTMNITSVNYVLEHYQKLWEIRDKRVDNWPMMNR